MSVSPYKIKILPLLYTIVLHGVLLSLLIFSMDFSSIPEDKPRGPVIQAKAIDQNKVIKAREQIQKRKSDEEKKRKKTEDEAQKKLAAMEKQRQAAEEKAKQAKKRRQQEEQKRKQEEQKRLVAEKSRKLAEEKRKQEQAAAAAAKKKRKEEERKIAEAKAKKEAERKRKEEEARRKAEAERQLQEELAAENARIAAERQQYVMSELDKYKLLIKSKIESNLLISNNKIPECVISIRLGPGGMVLSVSAESGGALECAKAKNAIFASSPLPVSKDKDVFNEMREIRYTFGER